MVRASNFVLGFLNIVALLAGIAMIAVAFFHVNHPRSATLCDRATQKPLFYTGLFLLILSFLGMVGSCFRISFFLYIYSTVLFLMILGFFALSVFTLLVTNKGVGKAVAGKGFKEYRIGDYSRWLRKHVVNAQHWDEIKSCLVDSDVCHSLAKQRKPEEFYKRNLSPLESGCCKPPVYCKFKFVNGTYWVPPETGPGASDLDCTAWNNNQKELCFNCDSCKAGVLANMRHFWRLLTLFDFTIVILLIVIFSVGCCALSNSHSKYPY